MLYQDLHLLPSTQPLGPQRLLQQTVPCKLPLDLFLKNLLLNRHYLQLASYLLALCTTFRRLTRPVPLKLRVMWQENGKHMSL